MRNTGLGISGGSGSRRGGNGFSAVAALDQIERDENVPPPQPLASSLAPPSAYAPMKTPTHLRADGPSHRSKPPNSQRPSSPPRALSTFLSSFIPFRRSVTVDDDDDDLSTFQYPKSPSLLRPPPTVRHSGGSAGGGGGRRRACLSLRRLVLALSALSLLAILYASTVEEETRIERWNSLRAKLSASSPSVSETEADRPELINYGEVLDRLRSGGHASHRHAAGWAAAKELAAVKPKPVEVVGVEELALDEDGDARGSAAEPVRLIEVEKVGSEKEGDKEADERRPKAHLAAKVEKEDELVDEGEEDDAAPVETKERPKPPKEDLPFLTDSKAGKDALSAADDSSEPDAEDEQAGLAAVVKQAEQEDAKQEADAEEATESIEKVIEEQRQQEAPPAALVKAKPKDKAQSNRVEAVVAVPPEAEAKAKQAVAKALSNAAKKAQQKKKKDASRYKRLLPLGAPPRRYLYGANFVIAADEVDASTVATNELTNKQVVIPSKKQLKKMFEAGKKRYLEEADDWRAYEWKAPPVHPSLQRFVDRLKAVRSRCQPLVHR